MIGNLALQKQVDPVYTTTGATTLGINAGQKYPAWLLPVSAASAVTLTLPLIAGTAPGATPVTYGIGGNQEVCIMNLNNQSVVLAAASGNAILGSSATVAQNATAVLVSAPDNTVWYRIAG